jgi:hypothetical protein
MKKDIRWIIQNNLTSENDFEKMTEACKKLGVESEGITVIPFSKDIPDFTKDKKTNIYYGSTTLMYNIYHQMNKPIGLFFDEETFSMENYLKVWGYYMLNSEGKITTFKKFSKEKHHSDTNFFIRPDADDKSFAGDVMTFERIKKFIESSTKFDNVSLTENTKILVSEPYNISKEWRNYIVNGKVVTSSLYRKNFKLCKDGNDIPEDMIRFVEERCEEYAPHALFAMDVALCGDDYYIIECNCLNSSGFYNCDIEKLIAEVSKYVSEHE